MHRSGIVQGSGAIKLVSSLSNLHFRISIIKGPLQWSYLHDRPCSMKPLTPIYIPMQQRDKIRRCTYTRRLLVHSVHARGYMFWYIHWIPYVYSSTVDSYVVKLILLIHMETPYNMIKVVAVPVSSRSFRGAISCSQVIHPAWHRGLVASDRTRGDHLLLWWCRWCWMDWFWCT